MDNNKEIAMSTTLKLVELVDKLRLQKFFMEKDNKVMLNLSFDPKKIESILDQVFPTKGKAYEPNDFEKDCIRDLEV